MSTYEQEGKTEWTWGSLESSDDVQLLLYLNCIRFHFPKLSFGGHVFRYTLFLVFPALAFCLPCFIAGLIEASLVLTFFVWVFALLMLRDVRYEIFPNRLVMYHCHLGFLKHRQVFALEPTAEFLSEYDPEGVTLISITGRDLNIPIISIQGKIHATFMRAINGALSELRANAASKLDTCQVKP